HALAILDRGKLVADGTPDQLMQDMDAQVVTVEAGGALRLVRQHLEGCAAVQSISQLGSRLHVLLDRQLPQPEQWMRQTLADAGLDARCRLIAASLEDVFVAVTGGGGDG